MLVQKCLVKLATLTLGVCKHPVRVVEVTVCVDSHKHTWAASTATVRGVGGVAIPVLHYAIVIVIKYLLYLI